MLGPLDWALIVAYFLFSFGIAIVYARKAGRDTGEFFLSGRSMPWWLAGTSMVATTFAADTPLLVTEIVAEEGVAGNWLWWNMAIGGMLAVFFFARLWRRSGILTDVEFVEVRYAGRAAAWLRGIKAVYFGLLLNGLIIAWVALAMETVIDVLFPGLTVFGRESFALGGLVFSAPLAVVAGITLVVALFSLLSGLWGVIVTDVLQFCIAMGGTIVLAVYALDVPEIGGIEGLMAQLPESTFRLLPTFGETAEGVALLTLSIPAFIAFVGVQWWSSWYPGAEPGGGGYIAQRMMSAKDEPNALFATLWFNIAHYCLRPWPWVLTALVALVLYPDLPDARQGFVLVMRDVLPAGLLGLLVAAFLAAFMSTVSTQLNWGVSYLVNDLWKRFVRPEASERQLVLVSRVMTFAVAVLAIVVTTQLDSIKEAWGLILTASAGLGGVLLLRWYWWRINAWSELVATLAPIVLAVVMIVASGGERELPAWLATFPQNLFAITALTTALWLAATFLTRPTPEATLDAFYRRVRPAGPGWRRWADAHPELVPSQSLGDMTRQWVLGVVMVYATLFASGFLLFRSWLLGMAFVVVAGCAAAVLWRLLKRTL